MTTEELATVETRIKQTEARVEELERDRWASGCPHDYQWVTAIASEHSYLDTLRRQVEFHHIDVARDRKQRRGMPIGG